MAASSLQNRMSRPPSTMRSLHVLRPGHAQAGRYLYSPVPFSLLRSLSSFPPRFHSQPSIASRTSTSYPSHTMSKRTHEAMANGNGNGHAEAEMTTISEYLLTRLEQVRQALMNSSNETS